MKPVHQGGDMVHFPPPTFLHVHGYQYRVGGERELTRTVVLPVRYAEMRDNGRKKTKQNQCGDCG